MSSAFGISKKGMKYQYQLNKSLADIDRAFQERMSNSAHQREVADLQKAGLNPVLSVTGGNGASTPSGSSASVSDGSGFYSAAVNSATQLQLAQMQHDFNMIEIDRKAYQDRLTKEHRDGSSPYGQLQSALDHLKEKPVYQYLKSIWDATSAKGMSYDGPTFRGIPLASMEDNMALLKDYDNDNFVDIDTMIADLKAGHPTSSRKNIRARLLRQEARQQRRSERLTRRTLRRYERKYGK